MAEEGVEEREDDGAGEGYIEEKEPEKIKYSHYLFIQWHRQPDCLKASGPGDAVWKRQPMGKLLWFALAQASPNCCGRSIFHVGGAEVQSKSLSQGSIPRKKYHRTGRLRETQNASSPSKIERLPWYQV